MGFKAFLLNTMNYIHRSPRMAFLGYFANVCVSWPAHHYIRFMGIGLVFVGASTLLLAEFMLGLFSYMDTVPKEG